MPTGSGAAAATRGAPLLTPDGKGEISQEQIGSIWICPPQYWANEREELSSWLEGTEGLGSSTHGLDDTTDCVLVVIDGNDGAGREAG